MKGIMLNGLDLFSGIGGLTLALAEWVRPIAYCENDRYAQGVLLSRMGSGELPIADIWDDVTTLKANQLGPIDIIYGGFPCQDISCAGVGVGLGGERSGLFFHIARLISETNPRFVFLENVPAIRTRGLNSVVQTLTELGYDCRWTIVSAKEVGACHLRKRWFLLAYANGEHLRKQPGRRRGKSWKAPIINRDDGRAGNDSDTNGEGLQGIGRSEQRVTRPAIYNGWTSEPIIRGRDHGVFHRRDRLKALGNAVVPLQAQTAFKRLCGIA